MQVDDSEEKLRTFDNLRSPAILFLWISLTKQLIYDCRICKHIYRYLNVLIPCILFKQIIDVQMSTWNWQWNLAVCLVMWQWQSWVIFLNFSKWPNNLNYSVLQEQFILVMHQKEHKVLLEINTLQWHLVHGCVLTEKNQISFT